jgi:outer membrane lipopolysaccharide assembly protein LptE/RlpB
MIECLEYYCPCIIECFRNESLRRSTVADTQRLLAKAEEHEFSDMLEHRLYAFAVAQLSGRLAELIYTRDIKHPTIILEVVTSHDRWI